MRKVGTCCLQDVLGVGEALASLLLDATFYETACCITAVSDYESSTITYADGSPLKTIDLPKSNVLAFDLTDGNKLIVRPSGTEPKIKAYVTAIGTDKNSAHKLADALVEAAGRFME